MASPEIVIYTTMFCPYCHSAKALLARKGIAYKEIAVDGQRAARKAMTDLAGGRTSVPQIFVGDTYVGGCAELYSLERAGTLDAMLQGEAA